MLLVLTSILAQAITTSAGAQSEARLRSDDSGNHLDFVESGTVSLGVRTPRAQWVLSYTPSATQADITAESPRYLLFHVGMVFGAFRPTRRLSLSISESAAYGEQYLRMLAANVVQPSVVAPAATAGSPEADPTATRNDNQTSGGSVPQQPRTPLPNPTNAIVPGLRVIRIGSTATTVGAAYQFDSQWQARANAGYFVSGGLDASSRVNMPGMRTGTAIASLHHVLTPRDEFSLTSTVSHTTTQVYGVAEPRLATIASSEIGWRHAFDRRTTANLTAGVSYAKTSASLLAIPALRFPDPGSSNYAQAFIPFRERSFFPMVMASVRTRQGWQRGRLDVSLSEQVAQVVDRLVGTVSPRSTTALSLNWSRYRTTLNVTGTFARTVGGDLVRGELQSAYGLGEMVTHQLSSHWRLILGASQTSAAFAQIPASTGMWVGYLGVSYDTGNLPI